MAANARANLINPPSYTWFTGTMGGRRVAHSLATFRPCGPTTPPSICLGVCVPASAQAREGRVPASDSRSTSP